jgi:hypothetical protein
MLTREDNQYYLFDSIVEINDDEVLFISLYAWY